MPEPLLPKDLVSIQGRVARHPWMSAAISLLAKQPGPLTILEVGSWVGASMLTWAEALDRFAPGRGRILCVDCWAPYMRADDLGSDNPVYRQMDKAARQGKIIEIFRHNADLSPVPVHQIVGESSTILPLLAEDKFDLVYIDASHYYKDVLSDLRSAMRLVRHGGLLCGDDLEVQIPDVSIADVMTCRESDTAVTANGSRYHPGVTLAVAETLGRVPTYDGFWAIRRASDTWAVTRLEEEQMFIPSHFGQEERQLIAGDIAAGRVGLLADKLVPCLSG